MAPAAHTPPLARVPPLHGQMVRRCPSFQRDYRPPSWAVGWLPQAVLYVVKSWWNSHIRGFRREVSEAAPGVRCVCCVTHDTCLGFGRELSAYPPPTISSEYCVEHGPARLPFPLPSHLLSHSTSPPHPTDPPSPCLALPPRPTHPTPSP
jgi:hypothetical protein